MNDFVKLNPLSSHNGVLDLVLTSDVSCRSGDFLLSVLILWGMLAFYSCFVIVPPSRTLAAVNISCFTSSKLQCCPEISVFQ